MRRLLIVPLFLLAGCGYHFPGQGSGLVQEARVVRVTLFVNRTAEPYLENRVTDSMVGRLARSEPFRVAGAAASADAILSGEIIGYSTVPISYDRQNLIKEYRSTMIVSGLLTQVETGRVLWRGTVSWNEEYSAGSDLASQEFNESQAIRMIADRIAEDIYYRILDDF